MVQFYAKIEDHKKWQYFIKKEGYRLTFLAKNDRFQRWSNFMPELRITNSGNISSKSKVLGLRFWPKMIGSKNGPILYQN